MKLGFREGLFFDEARLDWDGKGPRPISWALWYPAADDSVEEELTERSWFKRAPFAKDAPIAPSLRPYPLVLLSHGTGGSAANLEWLARRLVKQGFAAIGVNHHGNTGREPYRAEGFACLWERARDLSLLLDDDAWRGDLSAEIDIEHAFVAGFSAGAYTAMLLLGAIAQFSQFEPSRMKPGAPLGPREFPDLANHIPKLLEESPTFRQSWSRMSQPYGDKRIKAGLICAPGRSVLGFSEASLAQFDVPTVIAVGDADRAAPAETCSFWLDERLPHNDLKVFAGGIGHYVFLPEGTALGLAFAAELFTNPPAIERSTLHDDVGALCTALFRSTLE